jgi:hypothetical protein
MELDGYISHAAMYYVQHIDVRHIDVYFGLDAFIYE